MQKIPLRLDSLDWHGCRSMPCYRSSFSLILFILLVASANSGCRSDGSSHALISDSLSFRKHSSQLSEKHPEAQSENRSIKPGTDDSQVDEIDSADERHEDELLPVAHIDDQTSESSELPAVEEPVSDLAREESLPTQTITLAAVIEAIDRDNPTVHFTRFRINEAYAQWQRARVLWLPSLRAGVNYNKHEGRIQDVVGSNIETSRGAFYTGLGANAVGASSPSVPGIYANFHLTDAIFQPKIAAWVNSARQANSRAVTNDLMLQASHAYWELLSAEQEHAISREILELAEHLSGLTDSYAATGQGLAADADRVRTELALRRNDLTRAEENVVVTSARLAQLLSGDPTIQLQPLEPAIVPVDLVSLQQSIHDLVAQGLSNRPEIQENRALVCEAVERLEREKKAPLIPSILLGASYGGFSAGTGGNLSSFADRLDTDAIAYWEIRNLGLGERAARGEAGSRVDQSRMRQIAQMDLIAREIVETHAQVRARRKQIGVAREAVSVARNSYDKNIDRITNAQGLPIEALQSIQALSQAQREYLRVVVSYNQSQFALHRALGWPSTTNHF